MMNLKGYYVGVDIAKEKFDVCFIEYQLDGNQTIKGTREFSNTLKGWEFFEDWMKGKKKQEAPVKIVMEATGIYWERLAYYLNNKNFFISVVLPNKARSYANALGLKSKNDRIDAKGLALMGAQQSLKQWEPFSTFFYELKMVTRRHEQIQNDITAIKNQLHSLNHSQAPSKLVLKHLEESLTFYEKQRKEVLNHIQLMIDENSEIKRKVKNITKIKGLSTLSVATVLAETNGFILFENQRQLASYAGYDVVQNQSGKREGKTKISKKGNAHIRRILNMPALTAISHKEPTVIHFFTRILIKTQIKKKAYTAVQRKLLILIYTLWTKDVEYNPGG